MTEVVTRPETNGTHADIDRSVPIPYYYQLQRLLREQIVTGQWQMGQQVPSEKQLCEQYAVSRTTVRQAMGQLVQEGLVYHVKGKGTFVGRKSVRG